MCDLAHKHLPVGGEQSYGSTNHPPLRGKAGHKIYALLTLAMCAWVATAAGYTHERVDIVCGMDSAIRVPYVGRGPDGEVKTNTTIEVDIDTTYLPCDEQGGRRVVSTGTCSRAKGRDDRDWLWCRWGNQLVPDNHIIFYRAIGMENVEVPADHHIKKRDVNIEVEGKIEGLAGWATGKVKRLALKICLTSLIAMTRTNVVVKCVAIAMVGPFLDAVEGCQEMIMMPEEYGKGVNRIWAVVTPEVCAGFEVKGSGEHVVLRLDTGKSTTSTAALEAVAKGYSLTTHYSAACPGKDQDCKTGFWDVRVETDVAMGWNDNCFLFGMGKVCSFANITAKPPSPKDHIYSVMLSDLVFSADLHIMSEGTGLDSNLKVGKDGDGQWVKCIKAKGGWLTDNNATCTPYKDTKMVLDKGSNVAVFDHPQLGETTITCVYEHDLDTGNTIAVAMYEGIEGWKVYQTGQRASDILDTPYYGKDMKKVRFAERAIVWGKPRANGVAATTLTLTEEQINSIKQYPEMRASVRIGDGFKIDLIQDNGNAYCSLEYSQKGGRTNRHSCKDMEVVKAGSDRLNVTANDDCVMHAETSSCRVTPRLVMLKANETLILHVQCAGGSGTVTVGVETVEFGNRTAWWSEAWAYAKAWNKVQEAKIQLVKATSVGKAIEFVVKMVQQGTELVMGAFTFLPRLLAKWIFLGAVTMLGFLCISNGNFAAGLVIMGAAFMGCVYGQDCHAYAYTADAFGTTEMNKWLAQTLRTGSLHGVFCGEDGGKCNSTTAALAQEVCTKLLPELESLHWFSNSPSKGRLNTVTCRHEFCKHAERYNYSTETFETYIRWASRAMDKHVWYPYGCRGSVINKATTNHDQKSNCPSGPLVLIDRVVQPPFAVWEEPRNSPEGIEVGATRVSDESITLWFHSRIRVKVATVVGGVTIGLIGLVTGKPWVAVLIFPAMLMTEVAAADSFEALPCVEADNALRMGRNVMEHFGIAPVWIEQYEDTYNSYGYRYAVERVMIESGLSAEMRSKLVMNLDAIQKSVCPGVGETPSVTESEDFDATATESTPKVDAALAAVLRNLRLSERAVKAYEKAGHRDDKVVALTKYGQVDVESAFEMVEYLDGLTSGENRAMPASMRERMELPKNRPGSGGGEKPSSTMSRYVTSTLTSNKRLLQAINADRWFAGIGLEVVNGVPYFKAGLATDYVFTHQLSFQINPVTALLGGDPKTYVMFEGFSLGFNSVLLVAPWEEPFSGTQIEEALREAATMTPKVLFGNAVGVYNPNALVQKGADVFKFQDNDPRTAAVTTTFGMCSIHLRDRNRPVENDVRKQSLEAEARHELHTLLKKKEITMVNAMSVDDITCDGTEHWAMVQVARAEIGNEEFTGIRIVKLDVPVCDRTCSGNAGRGAPRL